MSTPNSGSFSFLGQTVAFPCKIVQKSLFSDSAMKLSVGVFLLVSMAFGQNPLAVLDKNSDGFLSRVTDLRRTLGHS